MTGNWPYLLLLPPAVLLASEDFRLREVSILWLAALFAASAAAGIMSAGFSTALLHTAVNAGLVLLFIGMMALWQMLRRRRLKDFFTTGFGAGDAVMMLAISPLFAPVVYVRFLLAGFVVALVWWTVRRVRTIPLAGVMAVLLAAYAVCKITAAWS